VLLLLLLLLLLLYNAKRRHSRAAAVTQGPLYAPLWGGLLRLLLLLPLQHLLLLPDHSQWR